MDELAGSAVNHLLIHSLEQQLADRDASWRTRCEAAFEQGMRRGRAAWPLAFILGAFVGAGAGALIVLAAVSS